MVFVSHDRRREGSIRLLHGGGNIYSTSTRRARDVRRAVFQYQESPAAQAHRSPALKQACTSEKRTSQHPNSTARKSESPTPTTYPQISSPSGEPPHAKKAERMWSGGLRTGVFDIQNRLSLPPTDFSGRRTVSSWTPDLEGAQLYAKSFPRLSHPHRGPEDGPRDDVVLGITPRRGRMETVSSTPPATATMSSLEICERRPSPAI